MPVLSSTFCLSRSWDLNKICYKSGVPIIENGMIERVSAGHGVVSHGAAHRGQSLKKRAVVGMGFTSPMCCKVTVTSIWEGAGLGSAAGLGGWSRRVLIYPC